MSTATLPQSPTPQQSAAGPLVIAAIFAGESLVRALNVSVLPLQAYDLLGSSQRVSLLATCVSLCVMCTTLFLPVLFRNVRRRWTYTAGVSLVMAAALMFASYTVAGQILGQYLRNTGAALMNVTLSLYIMDNIRKADLAMSEPVRLAASTVSWVVGPMTGAWLYTHYGPIAAHSAVLAAGGVLLTGFWYARLRDTFTLTPGTLSGFNPLANARAFFSQPRLRLAWSIAFARSAFWSGVFIYGPLLVVEGGLSKAIAGMVISASQIVLPLSLVYGWLSRRYGVRPIITLCFWGMAIASLCAGLLGEIHVWTATAFLLLGSFCATGLDGVGGVPFLRAVKPRQRRDMASVYRTFFESAELIPGFVYAIVLLHFHVGAVFVLLSGLMVLLAGLSWRYLPKSM